MKLLPLFLFLNLLTLVGYPVKNYPEVKKKDQLNHAPKVKVLFPLNNSKYKRGIPIGYSIEVNDKEDGDSKFDEIAENEVLLEADYLNEEAKAREALIKKRKGDDSGLSLMKGSNCMNCHSFHSKSIGPSFIDIRKKYVFNQLNKNQIINHIIKGSTGIWGNVTMPSHPEISNSEALKIAEWILKIKQNSNIEFYRGTKGSIHENGSSYIVLSASYTDHGVNDKKETRLKGGDAVLIKVDPN